MAELSRKSRLFLAAGKVLRRRSMRPVTRLASTMHALTCRITKGRAQSRKYPTMLLSVTRRKTGKTQNRASHLHRGWRTLCGGGGLFR